MTPSRPHSLTAHGLPPTTWFAEAQPQAPATAKAPATDPSPAPSPREPFGRPHVQVEPLPDSERDAQRCLAAKLRAEAHALWADGATSPSGSAPAPALASVSQPPAPADAAAELSDEEDFVAERAAAEERAKKEAAERAARLSRMANADELRGELETADIKYHKLEAEAHQAKMMMRDEKSKRKVVEAEKVRQAETLKQSEALNAQAKLHCAELQV